MENLRYISDETQDYFDAVVENDSILWDSGADRWPNEVTGEDDNGNCPPIKRVSINSRFIASQDTVDTHTVRRYVRALHEGDSFPPLTCIKTPKGIVVWNGHHRLTAHLLAGRKTVKVRFYGSVDQIVA